MVSAPKRQALLSTIVWWEIPVTCKTLEMPLSKVKIFWGTPRDPLDALESGACNLIQHTFQSHLLFIISLLL